MTEQRGATKDAEFSFKGITDVLFKKKYAMYLY